MRAIPRWCAAIGIGGVVCALTSPPASAQTSSDAPQQISGLEVGLRTGYQLPYGKLSSADTLSLGDYMAGKVPLTLALGGRTHTNYSFALVATYGIGILGSKADDLCTQDGGSCSVHDLRIGPEFLYHFAPTESIDPWASFGLGFEWWTLSEDANGVASSLGASGFEFVNLQGGVAFPVASAISVAPSLSFALGRFSSISSSKCGYDLCLIGASDIEGKSWHGWVGLGVRVTALVQTRRRHRNDVVPPPPPPPPPPPR